MNSQNNLTTAKIRRMLLIAALLICPFLAMQTSNAQQPTVTATLLGSTSVGGPYSQTITITQNQQFFMQLAVTTNFDSSGYTVFYLSNNGSGLFRLVSRVNLSPIHPMTMMPVFNDPTTPDGVAFGGNAGLLDPVNDFDLGYTGDSFNNQPGGSYSLQMITVNTLNAPVGTYTILTDRGVMTDRTGGGFVDRPFSAMLTINVIPEPTTIGLAVVGGGMLLVAAWRKRRSRV